MSKILEQQRIRRALRDPDYDFREFGQAIRRCLKQLHQLEWLRRAALRKSPVIRGARSRVKASRSRIDRRQLRRL